MSEQKRKLSLNIDFDLTIENAEKLHEILLDAFAGDSLVQINISGVSKIDLSGYQLIISAFQEARLNDKEFLLTGTLGEDLRAAITASGLCGFTPENGEEWAYALADMLDAQD